MDRGNSDRRVLAELLLRRELNTARERDVVRPRPDPLLPAPLAVAQWRIWFLTRLHPESAVYNEVTALRVRGSIDRDALLRSVAEVVARHEILRTRFIMADGEPAQVVGPADSVRCPGQAARRPRCGTSGQRLPSRSALTARHCCAWTWQI